jgi:hypothetical protein
MLAVNQALAIIPRKTGDAKIIVHLPTLNPSNPLACLAMPRPEKDAD